MEEERKKGFVVRDRRRFTPDGDVKESDPQEEKPETTSDEPSSKQQQEAVRETGTGEDAPKRFPEVTFSTFVFSLSSSALVHLGEVPDPNTNKIHKDLALAKQIIDTLAMLQEKTRGNLEKDEEQLLQTVLYDLRLRFVKQSDA